MVRHLFEDVAVSRRCPTCESVSGQLREYQAIVWPSADESVPGKRVDYWAVDGEAAEASLRIDFGADVHFTLWNEDDANRPR